MGAMHRRTQKGSDGEMIRCRAITERGRFIWRYRPVVDFGYPAQTLVSHSVDNPIPLQHRTQTSGVRIARLIETIAKSRLQPAWTACL